MTLLCTRVTQQGRWGSRQADEETAISSPAGKSGQDQGGNREDGERRQAQDTNWNVTTEHFLMEWMVIVLYGRGRNEKGVTQGNSKAVTWANIYVSWWGLGAAERSYPKSKRPWCWERLKAGGEGDNRGWYGWMVSLTQWTWVCVNWSWWWTGRPGLLRFMESQRVRHNWMTNWTDMLDTSPVLNICIMNIFF